MPFRAHIRIADVTAERIDVESFHWGVTQLAESGGPARAHVQDFSFVKAIDASSPLLFARCCAARAMGEAVFVVERPGGAPEELLRYTFGDARVASIRPGGSARGADDVPLEEVTLSFTSCAVDVRGARGEWAAEGAL